MMLTRLPHDVLCEVLGRLDADCIAALARTSKTMRVFCEEEPLWMRIALRDASGRFEWKGDWFRTATWDMRGSGFAKVKAVEGFCSEFLYQRWYRCHLDVMHFTPELKTTDRTLERIAAEEMDAEIFTERFEKTRLPVCLVDIPEFSQVMKWNAAALERCYGDEWFGVSHNFEGPSFEMTLKNFMGYARSQWDEDPLYLFDHRFSDAAPEVAQDYTLPPYFANDLLALMDPEVKRPRHKWLLVGPTRSGSSWHIDPWASSAWNLLIEGRKRWALYPPEKIPPLAQVLVDQDSPHEDINVVCCSALRWFLEVLPCLEGDERPIEFVQYPGETVFIPQGWWHCVLNLDLTVSVTQNFMTPSSIGNAIHFLSQGGYSYFSTLFPVRKRSLVKRSPLPAVTSSWIGNLARAVWNKRLDLREQLWTSAEKYMFVRTFKKCLCEICKRHGLPPPEAQDCFPVCATSNLLFRTGDCIVKLYIHENPLNLCIQQLLESSVLSAISTRVWQNSARWIGDGIIDMTIDEEEVVVEVPYLVSTFVSGQQLSGAIKRLTLMQHMKIASAMGQSLSRFHFMGRRPTTSRVSHSTQLHEPVVPGCLDQRVEFKDLRSLRKWLDSTAVSAGGCFQAQDPNRVWSAKSDAMLSCTFSEPTAEKQSRIPGDFTLLQHQNTIKSWSAWSPFLAFLKWRHDVVCNSPSITDLPEHLQNQVKAYLPDDIQSLIPWENSSSNLGPALLHGDLTNDNILISLDDLGNPVVVDFADACYGDPLYDFVALTLSSFRSNGAVIESFASSYFQECGSGISSEFWKWRTQSMPHRISYVVMCYCILHEDDTFRWLFRSHPEYTTQFKSLNEMEETVWGPLNKFQIEM